MEQYDNLIGYQLDQEIQMTCHPKYSESTLGQAVGVSNSRPWQSHTTSPIQIQSIVNGGPNSVPPGM